MADQMSMTALPPGRAAEHQAALTNALRLAEARLKQLDETRARTLLTQDEVNEYMYIQGELARLHRELEEGTTAPEEVPEEQEPPDDTPTTEEATLKRAFTLNIARLHELRDAEVAGRLTMAQAQELPALEHLIASQQARLAQWKHAHETYQREVDIAQVLSRWDVLVTDKCAAYQGLSDALLAVAIAVKHLRRVHVQQEQEIAKLPRATAERLNFPDDQSAMRNLASRMPVPTAWGMLLGSGAGPITLNQHQLNTLVQNDPGCRSIPERSLRNFVEGIR